MTAISIIRRALRSIGAISALVQPSPRQGADSLEILNAMLDTWRTQRLLCRILAPVDCAAVSSQRIYTVGSGGDFDIARPQRVARACWVTAAGTAAESEREIDVLTEPQWRAIPEKRIEGTSPSSVYYDRAVTLGQLYPWPVPTGAGTLRLYTPTPISKFANVDANVVLDDGLEETLIYNLAVRLGPEFGLPVPPEVVDMAVNRMADFKRTNKNMDELELDPAMPGMCGGSYDYRIGR